MSRRLSPPGGEYDFTQDRRYAGAVLPDTESLKTTLQRVEPYWDDEIAPRLTAGDTVLVAAHGNSLRAIVKLELGTGVPMIYRLNADSTLKSKEIL